MAIRDKVTIRMKAGGKPFVSEVRRPGGVVDVDTRDGLLYVIQKTRKGVTVDWVAVSVDEIKSVEFERGQ